MLRLPEVLNDVAEISVSQSDESGRSSRVRTSEGRSNPCPVEQLAPTDNEDSEIIFSGRALVNPEALPWATLISCSEVKDATRGHLVSGELVSNPEPFQPC